ncbi:MAG: protoporphyrinogen/coproporphyrinogen oxidase [Desulfosudaceae bacterium]
MAAVDSKEDQARFERPAIAVVGGGISGVATAYFLKKQGFAPDLFEAAPAIGGRTGSLDLNGKMIDIGGKNIGRNYPLFRAFADDMGEGDFEYFGINSSTITDGRMFTLDSDSRLRSMGHLVRMTGAASFARFVYYALHTKANPDNGFLDGPFFRRLSDRRDHQPITRYFSDRFVNNFLRPITIRMNGSEPEAYHLGNFGSNIKMVLDRYDQLTHGMHRVLDKFAGQFSIFTGRKIIRLLTENGRVTGIRSEDAAGNRQDHAYDAVFLCVPAVIAADIVADASADLSRQLGQIRYNPVALIVAKYNRAIFTSEVRALVFGRDSLISNAGVYGINDLDMVRYTLSGRIAQETLSDRSDSEALLARAETELNRHVPVQSKEREGFVYRYFPIGLCSYLPFHHRFMAEVDRLRRQIRGLHLAGDYVRGASLEACFRSGKEAAAAFAAESLS